MRAAAAASPPADFDSEDTVSYEASDELAAQRRRQEVQAELDSARWLSAPAVDPAYGKVG